MLSRVVPSNCESDRVSTATLSTGDPRSSATGLRSRLARVRTLTVCSLRVAVRVVAFWLAVVVPVFYLPLAFRGFETRADLVAFVALVVVNLVALGLGHSYRHPDSDTELRSDSRN